ncbi:MAG TPA: DUF4097 family beta strand repeat-containing protein [Gemmatimonadaceae bacterium]|nr:DUF4097 family beta strand repeat-containing protein [Gemmatimonadaceae bacterium]
MMVRQLLASAALLAGALSMSATRAHAQQSRSDYQQQLNDWTEQCRSRSERNGDDHYRACLLRQTGQRATGQRIAVDAGQNGGIDVAAWDGDSVLIGAKVEASAPSEREAQEIASEVHIVVDGGTIRADGPSMHDDAWWSVSFQILVPHQSDLSLDAHNGGIRVANVEGAMELSTENGGIALRDVGGDVHGRTTNGGVHIRLAGDHWTGTGLDVETTNGGVQLTLPSDYSARLETGTVNGGMRVDFPITVQGRIGRHLSTQLGNGGATIRATTRNGGVTVRHG